jgi:hypothetical protein
MQNHKKKLVGAAGFEPASLGVKALTLLLIIFATQYLLNNI